MGAEERLGVLKELDTWLYVLQQMPQRGLLQHRQQKTQTGKLLSLLVRIGIRSCMEWKRSELPCLGMGKVGGWVRKGAPILLPSRRPCLLPRAQAVVLQAVLPVKVERVPEYCSLQHSFLTQLCQLVPSPGA